MGIKKFVVSTAIAGSLGAAVLGFGGFGGFGEGTALADRGWGPDIPWIPGPGDWVPDVNGNVSPGQIKNAACPWDPPGHWIGGPHGIPCT
jgi:hypothetical protein